MTTTATNQPAFSAWQLPSKEASLLNLDLLKHRASWIRDDLDPLIAREGPDVLRPHDVITLFTFFDQLSTSQLMLETIRDSRIHLSLLAVAGRATRWPTEIIEKAEQVIRFWETKCGPLSHIRVNIYGPGGRLHSISAPEDLQKETLLIKWQRKSNTPVAPNLARRQGDLGFKAGHWWINAMYAYHDGIIDSPHSKGGVTACRRAAYALLLARNDEINSSDPNHFTYRSRSGDHGRYRLTNGTINSRLPVRVLRSHNLHSFWAPRAGVRYDGLYKVSGWVIILDPKTRKLLYDISFTRLSSEPPLQSILNRPSAEEMDDYHEYKSVRQEMRKDRNPLRPARPFTASDRTVEDASGSSGKEAVTSKSQKHKRDSLLPSSELSPTTRSPTSVDDNPFFSGGLADQSGINRINVVRPDRIDYAPVINAASAAGASIDPFFAGALEERAGKIPALHLDAVLARPTMTLKIASAEGRPMPASAATTEKVGKRLSLDLGSRASQLMRRRKS